MHASRDADAPSALLDQRAPAGGRGLRREPGHARDQEVGDAAAVLGLGRQPARHAAAAGPRVAAVVRITVLRLHPRPLAPARALRRRLRLFRIQPEQFLDRVAGALRLRDQQAPDLRGRLALGERLVPVLGGADQGVQLAEIQRGQVDAHGVSAQSRTYGCQGVIPFVSALRRPAKAEAESHPHSRQRMKLSTFPSNEMLWNFPSCHAARGRLKRATEQPQQMAPISVDIHGKQALHFIASQSGWRTNTIQQSEGIRMGFSRWFVVGLVSPFALLVPAKEARALINVVGSIWCQGLLVDGVFQGYGVCYDFGRGGPGVSEGSWNPPLGGGGGGSGTGTGTGTGGGNNSGIESPPDFTESAISDKLKCALKNYGSADVRLGNKTLKWVNTYAFGKLNPDGETYGFAFSNTNVLPAGPGWEYIGGITKFGEAYGRLYKGTRIANTVSLMGVKTGRPNNSLDGSLTSFEMQLLIAAHEASHLIRDTEEPEARWYGIDAVLAWRQDEGKACSKEEDTK